MVSGDGRADAGGCPPDRRGFGGQYRWNRAGRMQGTLPFRPFAADCLPKRDPGDIKRRCTPERGSGLLFSGIHRHSQTSRLPAGKALGNRWMDGCFPKFHIRIACIGWHRRICVYFKRRFPLFFVNSVKNAVSVHKKFTLCCKIYVTICYKYHVILSVQ